MSICWIVQSGKGKNSLINKLIPYAKQKTEMLSARHKIGRHATKASRSFEYKIYGGSKKNMFVMDTPGIDSFGLEDVKRYELVKYFCEWEEIIRITLFVNSKIVVMIVNLIVEFENS